jgi:DNA polymerase-3 subunit delta'
MMNTQIEAFCYPWLADSYGHLQDLLGKNKLPAVILLNGSLGFGKTALALKIAELLNLNKSNLNLGINILGTDNSSNNKIKIDDIRNIISLSNHTNLYDAKKINVIINIENLTNSAANALLKSLEEDNKTYYIFTTSSQDQVLATLLSRCYKLNLVTNKNLTLKLQHEWLSEQGVADEQTRSLLLELANFGPLQALHYYSINYLDKLRSLEQILSSLTNNSSSNLPSNLLGSLVSIKELFQDTSDNKTKFNLDSFLNIMYYIVTKNNMKNAANLLLNYRKSLALGIALDSDNIIYELLYGMRSPKVNDLPL